MSGLVKGIYAGLSPGQSTYGGDFPAGAAGSGGLLGL